MKPTCEVRYTVAVHVSIKDGEITRVAVDDEGAELGEEVPPEVLEVLENQTWPAWEFGL